MAGPAYSSRRRSRQNEDAGPDDGANAQGHQVDRTENPPKAVLTVLGAFRLNHFQCLLRQQIRHEV